MAIHQLDPSGESFRGDRADSARRGAREGRRAGDDQKLQAFGPVVLALMRGAADFAASCRSRAGRTAVRPSPLSGKGL